MRRIAAIITSLLACSCGLSHGPGFSMNDTNYFMETPALIQDDIGYALTWRYGDHGFFFAPGCIVKETELLCSLQGTSSSGNLKGQQGRINLHRPKEVQAIIDGGAFWLEPDGSRIEIKVFSNAAQ